MKVNYSVNEQQIKKSVQDFLNKLANLINGFAILEVVSFTLDKPVDYHSSIIKDNNGNVLLNSKKDHQALITKLVENIYRSPISHAIVMSFPNKKGSDIDDIKELRGFAIFTEKIDNIADIEYAQLTKDLLELQLGTEMAKNPHVRLCDDLN